MEKLQPLHAISGDVKECDCHRNSSLTYKQKHTSSSSPTFGYVTKRNEVC